MRRLPALLLIIPLAAVASLGVAIAVRPAAVLRPVARALANARCPATAALDWTVGSPAGAQEVLEFKPVPAESAARIESVPSVRRRSVPAPPPTPDSPTTPTLPGGGIAIGKSGNIMRVGSDIHIERDQVVVGDVLAVGGDVTVDGHVEGDVVAMGGDVYLNSAARVDGDVVCLGGELHEEEGASIGGQRVTAVGKGRGHYARRVVERETRLHFAPHFVWLLITLLIAWAFAGLAPGRTGNALATLQREPGASLLTGFLAAILAAPSLIAVALLAALLCITIIGIPLAIAALLGYVAFVGLLWIWGYVIGAAALGAKLAARQGGGPASPTRVALYGVLVIGGAGLVGSLFHAIPGIGALGTLLRVFSWLAFSLATLLGSGAWLRNEFASGSLARLWGRRPAVASAAAGVPPAPAPPAAGAPPTGEPPAPPVQV
jgi:hypothetical protein